MSNEKAQINCAENGPYLLKGDEANSISLTLSGKDGDSVTRVTAGALCRCGKSSNKPFCDGSHKKIGFSGASEADGSRDRRDSYAGMGITIYDNRGLCAHAGICTDNLASVFRMGQEPWIDADGASASEIIALVEKCPSGALGYSIDNKEYEDTDVSPGIRVIPDGPYAVHAIELAGQEFGEGVSSSRYTLCRCGASKNKPFCDGSHWDVGFKDET